MRSEGEKVYVPVLTESAQGKAVRTDTRGPRQFICFSKSNSIRRTRISTPYCSSRFVLNFSVSDILLEGVDGKPRVGTFELMFQSAQLSSQISLNFTRSRYALPVWSSSLKRNTILRCACQLVARTAEYSTQTRMARARRRGPSRLPEIVV